MSPPCVRVVKRTCFGITIRSCSCHCNTIINQWLLEVPNFFSMKFIFMFSIVLIWAKGPLQLFSDDRHWFAKVERKVQLSYSWSLFFIYRTSDLLVKVILPYSPLSIFIRSILIWYNLSIEVNSYFSPINFLL